MQDEPQGQAPSDSQAQPQDGGADSKTFDAAYVEELRAEAAKYRTQLRDAQSQLKELAPKAQGSEELAAKLAALEADLSAKTAEAERAAKQALLVRIASKAGIDPDIAELLDLSKLDLSDEAKVVEVLGKFARPQSNGAQVKPGTVGNTGMTEAELRSTYFGGKSKTTIFGG
jgi:hypothetical protein